MKKGQVLEGVIKEVVFPNKGIVEVENETKTVIVKNGVPKRKMRGTIVRSN